MSRKAQLEGALKFALVVGLHLALIATLARPAAEHRTASVVSTLDLRLIVERLPIEKPVQAPAVEPPKPPQPAPAAHKPVKSKSRPAPKPRRNAVPSPQMAAPQPQAKVSAPAAAVETAVASAPAASEAAPSAAAESAPVAVAPAPAPAPSVAPPPAPVVPPRFDAAYLRNPAPAYPRASRLAGQQGQVVLKVLVGAQGSAVSVAVQRSSGFERLDDAALNSVRQWRFAPAKRGEQAVEAWVLVPIVFRLDA
jgi:protein TonB